MAIGYSKKVNHKDNRYNRKKATARDNRKKTHEVKEMEDELWWKRREKRGRWFEKRRTPTSTWGASRTRPLPMASLYPPCYLLYSIVYVQKLLLGLRLDGTSGHVTSRERRSSKGEQRQGSEGRDWRQPLSSIVGLPHGERHLRGSKQIGARDSLV